MKPTYYLIQHSRGNHSAEQVYYHGKRLVEGRAKDCKIELVRMRKFLKDKFAETSTNDKLSDFIAYEMADTFFIKKQGNSITWA